MDDDKGTMKQERTVRCAVEADVPAVLRVMEAAKATMRRSGNLRQWTGSYPSAEVLREDIRRDAGRVVEEDGRLVAYFAFLPSPEPTYDRIYDGAWLDDEEPYHVVHRIATLPEARGMFRTVMDYCAEREPNLRIDTHRDNHIMQHLLTKHGFTLCGIILLRSGDERLAYQRISDHANRSVK